MRVAEHDLLNGAEQIHRPHTERRTLGHMKADNCPTNSLRGGKKSEHQLHVRSGRQQYTAVPRRQSFPGR